jgi:hypothetical protein
VVNISTTWSYSKISSFSTCPYQYYLSYIADPKPENEENCFNQYGLHVHEILEKFFKGELELFELADYYEEHFDEHVLLDFPPCQVRGQPYDLGQHYYDDGLRFLSEFDGLPQYKILGVEEDFTVDFLDGDKLHGFIDLVLEDRNGDIIVLDHKSKNGFKSKAEQKKYSFQPALYSLYIKEKYGKWPSRLAFNIFRKQEYVKIEFTEDLLNEAIDWAKKNVQTIRDCTDFLPKFNEKEKQKMLFFCNQICSFRSSCDHKYDYIDDDGVTRQLGAD